MRVTRGLLEEQVEYMNKTLKYYGSDYALHIERFNGLTWVKNQTGETIVCGTPLEVYNSLHAVRRVLYGFSSCK